MTEIQKILGKYTAGEAELEETNAALKEAGAGVHLNPGKNELTEENRRETVVGYYPEQADGWGLLDTGTGTLDKVRVSGGRLAQPVNEVRPNGSVNMAAYVTICGRTYAVLGDALAEIPPVESARKREKTPQTPDMRRRPELAGQTVRQHTRTGEYEVTYNELGYAVKAARAGGVAHESEDSGAAGAP